MHVIGSVRSVRSAMHSATNHVVVASFMVKEAALDKIVERKFTHDAKHMDRKVHVIFFGSKEYHNREAEALRFYEQN